METYSFLINSSLWGGKLIGQILGAARSTVFEKNNFKVIWCLIFEQKIGEVKAPKSLSFFFLQNQSLIDIFYNCDESFCAWLTEILHSSNFQKGAIYVRDFQGSCDTTLTCKRTHCEYHYLVTKLMHSHVCLCITFQQCNVNKMVQTLTETKII